MEGQQEQEPLIPLAEVIQFPMDRIKQVHNIGGAAVDLARLSRGEAMLLFVQAKDRAKIAEVKATDAQFELAVIEDYMITHSLHPYGGEDGA